MTLTNDTGGQSLMGYNKKERAAVTAPQTPENSRYGFEKPTESSLLVCGGKDILNQN